MDRDRDVAKMEKRAGGQNWNQIDDTFPEIEGYCGQPVSNKRPSSICAVTLKHSITTYVDASNVWSLELWGVEIE